MESLIFKHTTFNGQGSGGDPLGELLDKYGDPSVSGIPGTSFEQRREERRDAFAQVPGMPDPYGGSYQTDQFNPADPYGGAAFNNAGGVAGPAGAAVPAFSSAGEPGDPYQARLEQVESSGNPNAKAGTSSATGLHQFIDSTALQYKERMGYGHLSNAEFLQLRRNPNVSRQMERLFRADNAAILQRRNLPTDDGALYLAHFMGAGGAVKALSASRSAPISAVMTPAQIRANATITFRGRRLPEMSAGDLVDWARYKFRRRS